MNRKNINDIIKRFIPFSSQFIGPPRKKMKMADTYQQDTAGIVLVNLETALFPANEFDIDTFFARHDFVHAHNLFVSQLKNARIWGRNGAVITAKDIFITDVSREFKDNKDIEHSIFYTLKQKKSSQLKGTVALIGTAGAQVYFHWMFDILPRLELIKRWKSIDEIDYFVTEFNGLPFQIQTLKALGIPLDKIIASNENWKFHVQAETLILPSLASSLDQPTLFQVRFLQQAFGHLTSQSKPFRKLYISRSKIKRRMVVNEEEIVGFLTANNFEILYCEELGFDEQVKFFSEAAIVVSPHGSALTNIVFCKNNTQVIDIFNESQINPCFWFIAKYCNLTYSYFAGKSQRIDDNYKNDNIIIDTVELKNKISGAIKSAL
jgi:capsular polysaccharide biosynthesis protein